jgi:hypothetical protein
MKRIMKWVAPAALAASLPWTVHAQSVLFDPSSLTNFGPSVFATTPLTPTIGTPTLPMIGTPTLPTIGLQPMPPIGASTSIIGAGAIGLPTTPAGSGSVSSSSTGSGAGTGSNLECLPEDALCNGTVVLRP